MKNGFRASVLPPEGLKKVTLVCFEKNPKIRSRFVRSMRNDITRIAVAATEPETVQNRVFLSPDGKG